MEAFLIVIASLLYLVVGITIFIIDEKILWKSRRHADPSFQQYMIKGGASGEPILAILFIVCWPLIVWYGILWVSCRVGAFLLEDVLGGAYKFVMKRIIR